MLTIIINDCRDENAMGRQIARAALLFGGPVVPVGVQNDLEAAGCLVDELDAIDGHKGLILVNVAPRHGQAKKWPNGSPFGYFRYRGITVLSSLDGLTLSLAKKLGCLDNCPLRPLDERVFNRSAGNGDSLGNMIRREQVKNRINALSSQFRSFDFMPHAALDVLSGSLDSDPDFILPESVISDPPKAIWYIDCFGNAKTTLLPEDVDFSPGKKVTMINQITRLPCYRNLADVPDMEVGLVVGSSGIREKRFLEIVVQGHNAAKNLGLEVGQIIL